MGRVTNTEKYLNTLPKPHQQMLSQYRDHLSKIRYCIDENEKVIQRILQDVDKIFQNENQTVVRPDNEQIIRVRETDLDKVRIQSMMSNWDFGWDVSIRIESMIDCHPIDVFQL